MAGYKNITKILLVSLITGFIVAQVYENKKIDVQKFLENIRNMLKERMERAKRREEWKKRRKERKKEVKKMLIKKFSSFPRIRRPEDYIIHIRKDGTGGKVEDFLKKEMEQQKPEIKSISPQTVNKVLRANPVFNPFRTDRLKDILSKIQRPQGNVQNSSTSSGATEPDPQILRYMGELYNWFEEVYSKIQLFWDKVYRLFILDEKRFEYLSDVLCKGEITTLPWWYSSSVYNCGSDRLPAKFRMIHLYNPTNMPCNSLEPHKLKVDTKWLGEVITCVVDKYISSSIHDRGQCTPSLYTKARLIGNKGQSKVIKGEGIRPAYTSGKSLCYNLAALNFFGYKRNLELYYNSSYISSKVSSFIQYVQFMERIYKEKIIPALVDMCYVWCLCEDMGIKCKKREGKKGNPEDVIILLLYNLTPVYKNALEQWERYAEVKNFISRNFRDCSQNIKSVEEFLKKVGGELLQFIEEYGKKNIGKIPFDILKGIKEGITSNKVAGAFKMMFESATELFIHIFILKSKLLDIVVEKFKELDKTVIEGIEKKDKCFLEFAKRMAFEEIAGQNKSFIPYLSYLVSKNIDAPAVELMKTFTDQAEDIGKQKLMDTLTDTPAGGDMKIENILSYFKVLNYRIYAVLSSYKMEKCYYQKTDEELKGLTDELESYGCIFQDSNMNIGCAGNAFSFLGEAGTKLFMELFKGIDVNLGNLSDKIGEVGKNGIGFYKDKIVWVNEIMNMCEKIGEDEKKIMELLRTDLINTLIGACKPGNRVCKNTRCIDLIGQICNMNPLPKCENVKSGCHICRDTRSNPEVLKVACAPGASAGAAVTAYHRTGIASLLGQGYSCNSAIKSYMNLCDGINLKSSDGPEVVKERIGSAVLCSQLIQNNINTNVYIEKIEKLGVDYLKLLNQNSSPEKLKELYRKYKDGTLCND